MIVNEILSFAWLLERLSEVGRTSANRFFFLPYLEDC